VIHEVRQYCELDSRKPEDYWIAFLLSLTKKWASGREYDDVICIAKPVLLSIQVIDDGIQNSVFMIGNQPLPNGPVPPTIFRWDGIEYPGLKGKAWLLVAHLWERPNRSSDDDELAKCVWDDLEDVSANSVGSARKKVNHFFKDNGVPWKVTTRRHADKREFRIVTLISHEWAVEVSDD
jgi:hypothetical protein